MRALILLALLGAAVAVPRNTQRIVGGSDTTIEAYKFMSSMEFCWLGSLCYQACGGTLISTVWVASASHCYVGDPPSWWRVRLGSTNPESGGSTHAVSSIIIHPQYNNPQLDNDVALIRLQNPAVFSNSVGPARLAGPNYVLAAGTSVASVGWGALWQNGPSSNILQHVFVDVINQQVCAERYAYLKTLPGFGTWPDITNGMLCAGLLDIGGKDACQGDSGGPLIHDGDILYGITSWGYGCADPTYPGVNARVSFYSNWFVNNTNQ